MGFSMPEPAPYEPPFTLLWTTFVSAQTGDVITGADVYSNVEAIYNIISSSSLTITKYAIIGIIAGAYVFAGLNPNRVKNNELIVSTEPPSALTSYGLFAEINNLELNHGYEQTQIVIDNLDQHQHYNNYVDPFATPPINTPTLSVFMASGDDNMLGWYWIVNYMYHIYIKPSSVFDNTYITACTTAYTNFLNYINNNPRRYNPVAFAILRKKERKWWR